MKQYELDSRLYAIEQLLKQILERDADQDARELSLNQLCLLTGRGYAYWRSEIEKGLLPAKQEMHGQKVTYRVMMKDLALYNKMKTSRKVVVRKKNDTKEMILKLARGN